MKIKVGVIYGGKSVEHEISIISAIEAMINFDDNKYKVTDFIAPRDGEDTYYKDLKSIFPKSVLKNINNIYSDGTSDKLEMEIMEDVKLYFHK